MDTGTDQNASGRRESQGHQPNQGTPPVHQDQAYFGEHPGGYREGGNGGLKLVVIALVVIGATAIGLGLIFRSVDQTANNGTATSAIAEQNRLMREAMQMAREAQAMNRQRMAEMRQAMQEAEGYAEYGDYPGAEDHYDP